MLVFVVLVRTWGAGRGYRPALRVLSGVLHTDNNISPTMERAFKFMMFFFTVNRALGDVKTGQAPMNLLQATLTLER